MTCKRFEDVPVWQEAIRLAEQVYLLTEDAAFQKQLSLRDQVERAADLQESTIAGQRRLTEAGRKRGEQQKRAEAFIQKLKADYKPVPFKNAEKPGA